MPSLLDRVVVGLMPIVPKPIVRHFSRPYIAGATIGDAVRQVRDLNAIGAMATLDILGEHIVRPEEADRARDGYLSLLDTIVAEKLDSNVSVKLTQLGMKFGLEECFRRIDAVVTKAEGLGIFVRLDMEDSSCTDDTLTMHRRLKDRHSNVGVVIQAMLRRSMDDVVKLAAEKSNIRLCKGIYIERREIAYQDRETVNRSFIALLEILFRAGSYVGVATHDERLVFEALRLVQRHGIARDRYEFQMLLGVDVRLRRILLDSGHRLRVYVPFGQHWYAYSTRRLKENPNVAGAIIKGLWKTH
jgi:proline dehydrogenase